MNTYNTQALTHAGYIVALVIGLFTLFSDSSIKSWCGSTDGKKRAIIYIFLSFVLSLVGYAAFRLIFWSWLGSEVLIVTVGSAMNAGGQTWICAIQNNTMQEFCSSHYLRFAYTTDGLTTFGLIVILVISFLVSLLICTSIGEGLMHLKSNRKLPKKHQTEEAEKSNPPEKA